MMVSFYSWSVIHYLEFKLIILFCVRSVTLKLNINIIVGSVLAIACSYMYEEDTLPDPMPENNIFIRYVTDQETKPK